MTFEKPKRDMSRPARVEEVFLQARADDDFGVGKLDLVYSVNGGPEKTVRLFSKGAKSLTEVSAGHTRLHGRARREGRRLRLVLRQGARTTTPCKGPKTTTSDIYFMSPAVQPALPAGAVAGRRWRRRWRRRQRNEPGALSEQQRQIISATFNVERDKPKTSADKFKEDTVFVGLAQAKLREEVEELVQQMRAAPRRRRDENIRKIAELLPKAAAEMKAAEDLLKGQKTEGSAARPNSAR